MYRKISKENLRKWLGELKARAAILAPAKERGLWSYREFGLQDFPLRFRNSRLPPKGLFLDPLRALFAWKSSGGSVQLTPLPPLNGQRILIGLKPCDARALRILEPIFTRDYPDVFFLDNLSRTLRLGQACSVLCTGSFCLEMGIDPQESADFDIFFREIPAGYLARVLTDQGRTFTEGDFFAEASAGEWDLARREMPEKKEKPLFRLERVPAGVAQSFPDKNFWERVSAKCINCGICTYLCPTCHCFDLGDLQMPGQGVRFRCWDSCAFPGFTKMAGHNPREEKWRRYRQRVSHKFNFFYQSFQSIACVGCGRCVVHCPVNLDLREVLVEVAR